MSRRIETAWRNKTTQTVTTGAASAQTTNAFDGGIHAIRIIADQDVHYVIGANPVATADDALLPAAEIEYVGCAPGEKIAFIQNSAAGTAWVTELST